MSSEIVNTETQPKIGLLRPIAQPADVIQHHEDLMQMIQEALKADVDYGIIPGTQKVSLYKPGAERLMLAYGLFPAFTIESEEIEHNAEVAWTKKQKEWFGPQGERSFKWVETDGVSFGIYRFVAKCRLISRSTGEVVGEGIGSCSSFESKYVDRPREAENTILQMAQKRAMLAAVRTTFALTDRFEDEEANPGDAARTNAKPTGRKQSKAETPAWQQYFLDTFSENDRKEIVKELNKTSITCQQLMEICMPKDINSKEAVLEMLKPENFKEHFDI